MNVSRRQALVLAALDERGPLRPSGIAAATGISAGYVRTDLKPLAAWGQVEEHGYSASPVWVITATGRAELRRHTRATGEAS